MLIAVRKNLMEGTSVLSLVLNVATKDIMQIITLRQLKIMGITMVSVDFVSQEHGVPREGPKGFERRGLYA
jgi:hypothetical protein